ncbi:dihydrodipicolinate synthase family protein [Sinomonas atrocyanea]
MGAARPPVAAPGWKDRGMVTPTLPTGALVALATPTTAAGEPDLSALDRLVEHVVSGAVAGISPCGSTGEGARLTARQRLRRHGPRHRPGRGNARDRRRSRLSRP